ncbi:MAG: leucine-rich repeat domain-containing protein [Tannerellaceae bacterium]|jgi:hypothetical protein|nr:leucine-rich repeat domain-containing protein [Tannerellaceae bacterium]
MKRVLISFFALVVTVTIVSARTKAIIHVTPGSLITEIGGDKDVIIDLVLTGRLSAEDFRLLREMENLENLNLAETEIPYNEIPNEAFFNNYTLRSIVLPNTLEYIRRDAFNSCTSLTYPVVIPSSVRIIEQRAFYNCPLTQITFNEGLTTIGDSAFCGTNLTGTLDLPASLTSIGRKAYYLCDGLTGRLILPDGLTELGAAAFARCNFDNRLVIPQGIHEIPDSAFAFNRGLASLEWGNITGIGTAAFDSCTNLIELPSLVGVKNIGVAAFRNCTKLNFALVLPESLEILGQAAFANCLTLYGEIVIPKGVVNIGGATPLDPGAELTHPEGVFENTLIQSLSLHMDIAFIHARAFIHCRALKGKLRIGIETVINNSAFFDTSIQLLFVSHTYVRVDGKGNDTNNGTTWATAYASLEQAVATLTVGNQDDGFERTHEIYLQQGTYTLTDVVLLPDSIILRGGFVGDEMRGTAKGGTLSYIRRSDGDTAVQLGVTDDLPISFNFSNVEIKGLLAISPVTLQADNVSLVDVTFKDSVCLQGTVNLVGTLATSDLIADTLILSTVSLQTPAISWIVKKLVLQDSLLVTWVNGLNAHPLFKVTDRNASVSTPIGRMVSVWRGERLSGSLSRFVWKEVAGVQTLFLSTIPQLEDFKFPYSRRLLRPGDVVTLTLSLGEGVTHLLSEYDYLTWNITKGADLASLDENEYGKLITGNQPGLVTVEVSAFGHKQQIAIYLAEINIVFPSENGVIPPGGQLAFDIVKIPDNIPYTILSELQNPEIAHIEGSHILADARGTNYIHVWFADYPEIEDTHYFTIQDIAETIIITGTDGSWVPGEIYTFSATIEPAFAYAQEVEWAVSDATVAKIIKDDTYHPLSCTVEALSSKRAYISATSVDGYAYAVHYFGTGTPSVAMYLSGDIAPHVTCSDGALHLTNLDCYTITLHTLSARLVIAPRKIVTADAIIPVPNPIPGTYLLSATSPTAPSFTAKILVK